MQTKSIVVASEGPIKVTDKLTVEGPVLTPFNVCKHFIMRLISQGMIVYEINNKGDKILLDIYNYDKDNTRYDYSLYPRAIVLETGTSQNFYMTENNILIQNDVSWTSSDEEVISVHNGYVAAIGQGYATLHAEYKNEKLSARVTVIDKDRRAIVNTCKVNRCTVSGTPGETLYK